MQKKYFLSYRLVFIPAGACKQQSVPVKTCKIVNKSIHFYAAFIVGHVFFLLNCVDEIMAPMNLVLNRAFSLIELMVVITIIGILSTIAIPSYNNYLANSKITEAYAYMDTIGKSEITFFSEHNEFRDVPPNPLSLNQPMLFSANREWSDIGYTIQLGSPINFIFRACAGKVDDTGTELAVSTIDNTWTFTDINERTILSARYNAPPAVCNHNLATPATLGVTTSAGNNWVTITAVGDLNRNHDSSCTAISRLMRASPSTEGRPAYMGGFLVINAGD
jgi:prepilin-type N-terminal cleavage/methylation domain-containing protein